ncbi:MAG: phosphoribosylaminoimidazolesuccinocarboxamide synthase [Deltaproteobacteria bacterium]|nr:MAG: phosphoribosylaminoimidazolesuccinocarboxamide synthase [Deltaproteobacteria bacterium]
MLSPELLTRAIPGALAALELPELGAAARGKVRDAWVVPGGRRVLVTTDRVSAFDRVVGLVPYKGQVLNQIAAWWFRQCEDIVPNHAIAVPDPNAMVVRDAEPLPVEVVVRGYITGVTSTSLWTLYKNGVERPYGLDLPPHLVKNDPLPRPVITPTTKATGGAHDERLTSDEVVERGLVAPELWSQVKRIALELFARGQRLARKRGVLLVDTKYEFGLIDGELHLIDEMHTPDSSRYWLAESYAYTREHGGEPEHFDKELLRLWLAERGLTGDQAPEGMGALPEDIVVRLAMHYVAVYEQLTGERFVPAEQPAGPRVAAALRAHIRQSS